MYMCINVYYKPPIPFKINLWRWEKKIHRFETCFDWKFVYRFQCDISQLTFAIYHRTWLEVSIYNPFGIAMMGPARTRVERVERKNRIFFPERLVRARLNINRVVKPEHNSDERKKKKTFFLLCTESVHTFKMGNYATVMSPTIEIICCLVRHHTTGGTFIFIENSFAFMFVYEKKKNWIGLSSHSFFCKMNSFTTTFFQITSSFIFIQNLIKLKNTRVTGIYVQYRSEVRGKAFRYQYYDISKTS